MMQVRKCENEEIGDGYYTGLDYKAFTWLQDFLQIFPKIAVRQSLGGCGAAEGNSKPCKPFSPTQ